MTMLSSRRADWQPGHMPKLSYRNTAPSEPCSPIDEDEYAIVSSSKVPVAGASIREIRERLPRSPSTVTARSPTIQSAPKKKSSLFGGLFVKEPSMAALDQVAAQILAQRGSISPKTMPYVSSQKMPEYVPKVNTKWSGVPEAVELKEKQVKERQRAAYRLSTAPSYYRSRSTDGLNSGQKRFSIAESWDSRSTGSRPVFHDNGRPESVYSTLSACSDQSDVRSSVARVMSYQSTTDSSVPEKSTALSDGLPASSNESSAFPGSLTSAMTVELVPEHTSSPMASPLESSPITPTLMLDRQLSSTTRHRGQPAAIGVTILPVPLTAKRRSMPIDAFLAGEAVPLELPEEPHVNHNSAYHSSLTGKQDPPSMNIDRVQQDLQNRPDSSRARLGLRASMVIRTDAAPWNQQAIAVKNTLRSPQSPASPRGKLRFFTKGGG